MKNAVVTTTSRALIALNAGEKQACLQNLPAAMADFAADMKGVAIINFALTALIMAIGWLFVSPQYFHFAAMEWVSFPSMKYFNFIFVAAVTATTLGGLTVNLAAILHSLAFPNASEWKVNYIIAAFVMFFISAASLTACMPFVIFTLLSIFH